MLSSHVIDGRPSTELKLFLARLLDDLEARCFQLFCLQCDPLSSAAGTSACSVQDHVILGFSDGS